MKEPAIEIFNLSKLYDEEYALRDISLSVSKGTILGLIGPNGSGKTTLLSILSGLITASEGYFKITKSQKIGALIEYPVFYDHLSAVQNLELLIHLRKSNLNHVDSLLNLVGLKDVGKKRFKKFSLGMKQRLGIAATLIDNPSVIILDEPTNGLDPVGIREIREIIKNINQQGVTIIISSHNLSEIGQVCTDLAILHKGHLKFKGDKLALQHLATPIIEIASEDNKKLRQIISQMNGITIMNVETDKIILQAQEYVTSKMVNEWCFERNVTLTKINNTVDSIENAFFSIISQ